MFADYKIAGLADRESVEVADVQEAVRLGIQTGSLSFRLHDGDQKNLSGTHYLFIDAERVVTAADILKRYESALDSLTPQARLAYHRQTDPVGYPLPAALEAQMQLDAPMQKAVNHAVAMYRKRKPFQALPPQTPFFEKRDGGYEKLELNDKVYDGTGREIWSSPVIAAAQSARAAAKREQLRAVVRKIKL